jgi:hypothetical protein
VAKVVKLFLEIRCAGGKRIRDEWMAMKFETVLIAQLLVYFYGTHGKDDKSMQHSGHKLCREDTISEI